jgi:hypothetical protein
MKNSIYSAPAGFVVKLFVALQILLFSVIAVMAQDGGGTGADIDVNINKGGDAAWYMNWWIWVIAALVLIILIVAMTRRGGGTTVIKD